MVSVVTPLYNAQLYIEKAIQSVLAQTYSNWEMIIIDDCSTDASGEIAQKYAGQDHRIRYFRNDENKGIAYTRNRALELAQGRYLAFLDSDDLWRADKLEKQLARMKETGSPFCYGSCAVIDAEGHNMHCDRIVHPMIDYDTLLMGNEIPCLTVLLDREVIKDLVMPEIPHEDYATWLLILRDYHVKACAVTDIVADYRVLRASTSANKLRAAGWTWNIYRKKVGLSFGRSLYCWLHYVYNAFRKRRHHG